MSKSKPVENTVLEGLEPAERPKPSRIEEFLKTKAARGQHLGGDHPPKHGQPQHTKLKERVRRRP